jgi:acyl-CoA reductase-like NAD-dependent aldehyde dehydrogenase
LQAGYRQEPHPSGAVREDRLERLQRAVQAHQGAICDAIHADFGGRSRHESLLADVFSTLETIRHAHRHTATWMRPRSVTPGWMFRPARAWVLPQPLGVVGVIAPWNYPVNLALGPLACALAAGNRAIVKPSELTPRTAVLLARLVREAFAADEVAVVTGGPEVARAVTQLPLDHLVFTGSTQVGRMVATACAPNLVPVTLELGGKSPALVHPDAPLPYAVQRIAAGKLFNAGQTCIAPDYVLLPKGKDQEFVRLFAEETQRRLPDLARNPDYCAVANDRALTRLHGLVSDAVQKGATADSVLPGDAKVPDSRKMAPVLLRNVTDDMQVMRDEIFGPVLPIVAYERWQEALNYVNSRPRPLALYVFAPDAVAQEALQQTHSGGACINDTLLHFAQENLPFGGVGASGMGAYHGQAGFDRLSHLKGVYAGTRMSPLHDLLSPPYGPTLDRALQFLLGKGRRPGQ